MKLNDAEARALWDLSRARGCTCEEVEVEAHVADDGVLDATVIHLDRTCPLNPGDNKRVQWGEAHL